LSSVSSAMARIVFPSATMTWFRLPRGSSLNFLGASGTCSDSLLIKASQIHIPLYQTVASQGDYSCLWIPQSLESRRWAPFILGVGGGLLSDQTTSRRRAPARAKCIARSAQH